MVLRLMRYRALDPTLMMFAVLATVAGMLDVRVGFLTPLPLIGIIWQSLGQRASMFEIGLPIDARALLLSRVLTMLAYVLLPLTMWTFCMVTSGESRWSLATVCEVGMFAVLAIVLPNLLRPNEREAPPFVSMWALVVALALTSAAAYYWLPSAVTLAFGGVAIVAASYAVWSALPASFQTAPLTASAGETNAAAVAPWKRIARWTHGWWRPVVQSAFPPITLFYSALLVYRAGSIHEATDVSLLCLALMVSSDLTRQRLRWLQAFPFSARARLLIVLIPSLWLATCQEAARLVVRPHRARVFTLGANSPVPAAPSASTRCCDNRDGINLEYWRRVRGSGVPVITASWGESATADTMSVLGVLLYNPYFSARGNSARFTEWQFSRATTAVYGRPIQQDEYFAESHADRPPPLFSYRMTVLNGVAILALILAFTLLSEVGRSYRNPWPWTAPYLTVLLPFVVLLGGTWLDAHVGRRREADVFVPLTQAVFRHISAVLPGNPVVFVVIVVLPLIVLYAMLEWQFGRTESTGQVRQTKA